VILSWVIGLEFLLGLWLSLLGALALVGYWSAFGIILSVKVKVLKVGLCAYGWVTILLYCLWRNKHISYILTGYGTTPPLVSLTTGRKLSHKVIKLVEELSLGFLAGEITEALPRGLLAGATANPYTFFPTPYDGTF
jgi:hypothetical protein